MKYIICEDSGSGFTFFKTVRDICFTEDQCEVVSSYGNTNFQDTVKAIIEKLKQGDFLMLAFDSVEVSEDFNPKNIIISAQYGCDKAKATLYYTTYYCFEELFLSYDYLADMFMNGSYKKDDKELWMKLLNYIHDSIFSGNDYYVDNELVSYVKSIIKKSNRTKEKFIKAVLTHISGSIRGDFKITDGSLGKCWLQACEIATFTNKEYRCKNCIYNFKGLNASEKLIEIEQHSLCRLSTPFSTILTEP